ncbi:hypothetical protein K431DRAFT_303001 [Polychaeton citri CBS 116435]|uniref:Uncharacterized protein n=1 Tax=Polychaeton citri CBS 116435 TaxID=1314669 RepID=A0A9P4QC15_9PEZI|nr:hypothetical protein K431DRAFT_303001 [Polychaeton citri CBS 116435]
MTSQAFFDPNPSGSNSKSLRFSDTYSPSSLQLRLKLGPSESPSMILKISITFEPGRLPRVRIRTKRPRGRTYVEDSDEIPLDVMGGRREEPWPMRSRAADPKTSEAFDRKTVEVRPHWKSSSDRPCRRPNTGSRDRPPTPYRSLNDRNHPARAACRKRPRRDLD